MGCRDLGSSRWKRLTKNFATFENQLSGASYAGFASVETDAAKRDRECVVEKSECRRGRSQGIRSSRKGHTIADISMQLGGAARAVGLRGLED